MIEAFSLKNAHHFGDALASQARLRYRVFVEDRALDHSYYEDMEYDEFDTPAAVYFVWRDPDLIVRGLIRLLPTSEPYMAECYWPDMFEKRPMPKSPTVWEASRVCIDRHYNPRERAVIMPELLSAVHEFSLLNGIDAAVGVTRQHLIDHYLRTGVEWLCAPAEVEGQLESAFWVPVDHMRPQRHCERLGITGRVLSLDPVRRQPVAA